MDIHHLNGNLKGLIIDNDGTLHAHQEYLRIGRALELDAIAHALCCTVPEAEDQVAKVRQKIGAKQSLTVVVQALGLTAQWWNRVRETCYRPEHYLDPDPDVVATLQLLQQRYRVAIASNNPCVVTKNALTRIGAEKLNLPILGPENLGTHKADPNYFRSAARQLGLEPSECLCIGDRFEVDAAPSLSVGYAAVVVTGPKEFCDFGKTLSHYQKPFCHAALLENKARDIQLCGITGFAGAGKTTLASVLEEEAEAEGISSAVLSIDAFFRLSSRDRKAWLAEGKQMGEVEYTRRANQMTWWDFDKLRYALGCIRRGEELHLTNTYNRRDGGELTGSVHIKPGCKRVYVEGVPIAHLRNELDQLMLLTARSDVRQRRLQHRDPHRQGDEVAERFRITETFDHAYLGQYGHHADLVVDTTHEVELLVDNPF